MIVQGSGRPEFGNMKRGADGLWRASNGNVWTTVEGQPKLLYRPQFIVAGKDCLVELRYTEEGVWTDSKGTIFALRDKTASTDTITRCGVGWASLPVDDPLTAACAPHDYVYECPAYQLFHTRREADAYLASLVEQIPGWRRFMAKPFYYIVRLFGGRLWENPKTR